MTETEFAENRGFLGKWFHWCPTSWKDLKDAETRVLSYLKTSYKARYVSIGDVTGTGENEIWTISLNEQSENTPLVLIHGFGSGVALWALNLDALASSRPVYAFDVLGFGRSSRPTFSSDPIEAENQLVSSVEEWRKSMNLSRFILLGHSFGGFLAASYAIRYPEQIQHLVLADPWGFQERSQDGTQRTFPLWARVLVSFVQLFNPLASLRAAGPLGPKLVDKIRPDLKKKFSTLIEDIDAIPNYIYHCNVQTPSGEKAFKSLTSGFGWAKHPMVNRVTSVRQDIPMTFIYGARSWIDKEPGYHIKNRRGSTVVQIHVIQGAGHHVYADNVEKFNKLVNDVAAAVDEEKGSSYIDLENTTQDSAFQSASSSDINFDCSLDGIDRDIDESLLNHLNQMPSTGKVTQNIPCK